MVDFQYRVKHEYPHRSDLKKLSSLITYTSILISWFVLKCHKGTQASFQSIQNPDVMAEGLACPSYPIVVQEDLTLLKIVWLCFTEKDACPISDTNEIIVS